MKSIFLICQFDKQTLKYAGTISAAFETRELAKGYAIANSERFYNVIKEVPLYKVYETA